MAKIDLSKRTNYKYTFSSFVEVEDKLGMAYIELDLERLRMKQAAIIVWGALWHIDRTLEVEDVYKMLDKDEVKLEVVIVNALEEFVAYNTKNLAKDVK